MRNCSRRHYALRITHYALENSNLTVVSQQHFIRLGLDGRAVDFHIPAYEAVFQAAWDVNYLAVFEDDGVLYFAVGDCAAVVDSGIRPNVGVDDASVCADYHRAAYNRVDDLGVLVNHHFPLDVAIAIHEALNVG